VQKKLRRDLRLLRMDFAVDPDDASTLFHMGQVHAQMGNAAEARKCLSRLFQVERSPGASHMRRVFAILCELAMREGKYQEVLAMAERGLALFPRDPHMSYILAEALYELDQYKAAEELLIDIVNQPELLGYHAGTPKNLQRNMAMQSLGEVLRIQGAQAASEAVLRQVVQDFPRDTMAWYTLGRLYVDVGTVQGFEEVCLALQECPEGKVFAKLLLGVWHLVRSNHLAAEPVVTELIAEAPQMPLPRLVRAFCLERRGAALADRLLAYRDVLRVQPGNATAVASVARLEAAIAEANRAAIPAAAWPAPAAPSPVVIAPTRARVPAAATSAAAGPQEWCTSMIVGVAS